MSVHEFGEPSGPEGGTRRPFGRDRLHEVRSLKPVEKRFEHVQANAEVVMGIACIESKLVSLYRR